MVVPTGVGRADQVDALRQAAVQRFGTVDVWMNIAGVGAIGRFWEIPVEDYSRLIETNLKGVIYGSHAIRQFIAQDRGTLVRSRRFTGRWPRGRESMAASAPA